MNILLTGHRGFIGSHLLTALEKQNHYVSTYDIGDVLPSIIEQDWVIHLGAISSTVERDVDKILTHNYDFTRQLFNACKTYGVNMQYASSASIYGTGTDFRETATPDPRTPYAWSKYLCERYHLSHQGGNIVQGFRYFNVYGPEGEEHKGNQASPFYKFKKQAHESNCVEIFDVDAKRDFIHVSLIVELHLRFLEIKQSGIWNFGTGVATSFHDIATRYSNRVVKIPLPDIHKLSYQSYTCANLDKLNSTLATMT